MHAPTPAVDRFLDAVRAATIEVCDAWAPHVRLDATVPEWRFHRSGADDVRETYRGWFAHPGEFESLRRIPTPDGEVVEYLLVWDEGGVPHSGHHVHLLEVAEGLITRDVVFCGGRWPAALMAEMAAADAGYAHA